jgi:hypothetical protein
MHVCPHWEAIRFHITYTGGVYRALVGKPEGRRPLGRPRRRWEDNIKMDLREVGWRAWTGSIWLRIRTGGGLLWMRLWTFRVHKMRRISWVADDVSASQEGLCSMELVSKSLIPIYVRGWVDNNILVQPKVLSKRKIPKSPSGIKPAAQGLNQLRHRVPHTPPPPPAVLQQLVLI